MRRSDEAGFTLPEVLIAGTLAMLLALPSLALLRTTYRFVDMLQSRFKIDEEARQSFALLGDGGAVQSSEEVPGLLAPASSRGFALVESLRSHASLLTCQSAQGQSTPGACLRKTSEFVFPDGSLTLLGDTFPTLSVTCTKAGTPIPDCAATETRTVQGWTGSDPVITYPGQSTPVPTLDAIITVTNPFYALRAALPSAATERYRTMFTLGAEKSW